MFERPPVRISVPYTGWIFFTYICYQNCNDVCLKRPKINEKRPGSPFLEKHLERHILILFFARNKKIFLDFCFWFML